MDEKKQTVFILADYREKPSGIPGFLSDQGADVSFKQLKRGDYIINRQIIIERKSRDDFALSLIQNRLFYQCSLLKQSSCYPLLLVEGNPYRTSHAISHESIKGALLSVAMGWQIPIIYSADALDSAHTIMMAAIQIIKERTVLYRQGKKPKTIQKQQLWFLQGLPRVGPQTAQALFRHFGSIQKVLSASSHELKEVEGIGEGKANLIRDFLEFKINMP